MRDQGGVLGTSEPSGAQDNSGAEGTQSQGEAECLMGRGGDMGWRPEEQPEDSWRESGRPERTGTKGWRDHRLG